MKPPLVLLIADAKDCNVGCLVPYSSCCASGRGHWLLSINIIVCGGRFRLYVWINAVPATIYFD